MDKRVFAVWNPDTRAEVQTQNLFMIFDFLEYQENNRKILFSKISSEFTDGALHLCKIGMIADMKIATKQQIIFY